MRDNKQLGFVLGIGLVALALAVLSWTAYDNARRVIFGWQHETVRTVKAVDEPSFSIDYDVSEIINAHLFGVERKSGARNISEAPETKLQIRLMGLIASADQHFARALIAVSGSKTRSYSVGQAVEGTDASIHAVQPGRVLLKRGNAMESLTLERTKIEQSNNKAGGAAELTNPRETGQANQLQEQARKVQMNKAF